MREQFQVDLDYRLAGPHGLTPDTHAKTWFFDADSPDFDELLPRLFYDANVLLRQREPGDETWLALDSYRVTPVRIASMLLWDGEATAGKAAAHLPWILASGAVTWEYTSCHLIDETGAYDGMTGNDFSELILYRALAADDIVDDEAIEFLDKLYPGRGEAVFADRETRMTNLITVRATTAFRRAPGTTPHVSGPPQ